MSALSGLSDPERSILFIFGAARSGTTYLNSIVDRSFGYGMGPEGTFVAPFARQLPKYGDLREAGNIHKLVADISRCEMLDIVRNRWNEAVRFNVTPEQIYERLPEWSYAGVVYSVFECVSLGQGKSRVGNKDPGFYLCLDLLHQLFPTQARYLFIVRDGRDVALSMMQLNWSSNFYSCARIWKHSVDAVSAFAKVVEPERLLQIRYEDLLRAPRETLVTLEHFLDTELTPDQRKQFDERVNENSKQSNYNKWRTQMSKQDQRVYEAVAGNELRAWGYETDFTSPVVPVHQALGYEATEFWRKVRLNLPWR